MGIFILVLIILIAFLVRLYNPESGGNQLNIVAPTGLNFVVPTGLISIFISFYLFYEDNRVRKAKRENRREYMNERRQELLNNLYKKNKKSRPDDE